MILVRLLCCAIFLGIARGQPPTRPVSTVPPENSPRCEPIQKVELCLNVDWKNATFPNFRQQTQMEANKEMNDFTRLIQSCCSNAIVHFLCSFYTPICVGSYTLEPCEELCEYVRGSCIGLYEMTSQSWPDHLRCENFPKHRQGQLCLMPEPLENLTIPDLHVEVNCAAPSPTPSPSGTIVAMPSPTPTDASTNPIQSTPSPLACQNPLTNHPLVNRSYRFGEIDNCAVPCDGIYFSRAERNTVAPLFILLCAIICIAFTLFTVGTFLIDRQRFHYPERPVIFLALCYLILSVAFIVGSIVKLANSQVSFACSDTPFQTKAFVFQNLPGSSPTYHSASCVILFIFVYYFQMAGAIWWVVLALTWCLASSLKWGEEAIERPWILYHCVAWSLPGIQAILILILHYVDGDQLSGICYPGNFNNTSLGVFVFFPLALYLLIGVMFLAAGFISLIHIRIQIRKDPVKSSRLQRLIIRILIYSLLYIIPSFIFLVLVLYEMVNRNAWERAYNAEEGCRGGVGGCSSQPTFVAFLLRYLVIFVIGIFSTFWVISWKTFLAWKKFFKSVFCCQQEQLYIEPNKKATKV